MKSIGRFFTFVWRALDGVRKAMHFVLLTLLFVLIVAALSPSIPIVPLKAALVIAPQGTLVEQLAGDPFERAVAEMYGHNRAETLVRDVVEALEIAKEDERIELAVLDLSNLSGGGLSKLAEVAAAIRDFRSSGKKVIAYGDTFDQAQYYIAANADELYLDPQGVVLIQGYGYYRTFLKGLLDKLAVDVNVFRAGEFKSYTEQFTRTDMSPEDREASLGWLNALWHQYQRGIAEARGPESTDITEYANEFATSAAQKRGDLAAVALERGLVTGLKTRQEVEEQLKALVGEDEDEHSFQSIAHWEYLAATRGARRIDHGAGRIGVVVAVGEIYEGDHPPGTIGADSTARLLRQALHDDEIKAVVLRIDSPGGSMFGSEIIRREVGALREAGKPVIASMSSVAASGGYYIAMDADEIWASPATLTGSIGVWGVYPTIERSLQKIGVTVDGVGTTPLSDALRMERSLSADSRTILQNYVEHSYRVFVEHVASAREKTFEQVDAVAQGRVWSGADAAKHGLVDHLGAYRDALNAAAKRANLGEDYSVKYIEPPLGWREALAVQTQALAARIVKAVLPERQWLAAATRDLAAPVEREIERLVQARDTRGVYYYCPCNVH